MKSYFFSAFENCGFFRWENYLGEKREETIGGFINLSFYVLKKDNSKISVVAISFDRGVE